MPVSSQVLGERLQKARANLNMTQEKVAEALGLSRPAMVQVEAGKRAVSSFELEKLAYLYGRTVSDLLADAPEEEDPVLFFREASGESEEGGLGPEVTECIALLREASALRRSLGDRGQTPPPLQQYPDPISYQEAVDQGKEMATIERHRLNLGTAPIADVAQILSSQAIWAAAIPMRDEVSGLFLNSKTYGMAVVVNQTHSRARRRFSYSHEYAHALVDRQRSRSSSVNNKNELIEKRANAFAGEFLLPEMGIKETLDQLRKGAAVRINSMLYDPTTNLAETHETRNEPGSQRIGVQEVAILAHKYQISFDMAAYRMRDIEAVGKAQVERLLNQRELGRILIQELKLYNDEDPGKEDLDQPYLKQQLVFLAIEALRREKISGGRFREACKLAGCTASDLLRVVEASKEA